MVIGDEIVFAFKDAYDKKKGGFHPERAAHEIANSLGKPNKASHIESILMNPQPVLYRDVLPFFSAILTNPQFSHHSVKVWTEGEESVSEYIGYQEIKLINSGLVSALDIYTNGQIPLKQLLDIQEDKCGIQLEEELETMKALGFIGVYIDDKESKLKTVQKTARDKRSSVICYQIHRFPDDRSLWNSELNHINSLADIDLDSFKHIPVAWRVDADNTLFDHERVKRVLTDDLMDWYNTE